MTNPDDNSVPPHVTLTCGGTRLGPSGEGAAGLLITKLQDPTA